MVDYRLRQDNYRQNCVNKARAALKCDGKCQVMKRMHAAGENENVPEKRQLPKQIDLLTGSFYLRPIPLFPAPTLALYGHGEGRITNGYTEIFHPPPPVFHTSQN
jgi:hypothetical protein